MNDKIAVFRRGEERECVEYLRSVAARPIASHANDEIERLGVIFDTASAILMPFAKNDMQRFSVSEEGIRQTYLRSAEQYQSLALNSPIIFEEGILQTGGLPYLNKSFKTACERGLNCRLSYFEPGKQVMTRQRMFGVGYFGFASLFDIDTEKRTNALTTIALPSDYLRVVQKYNADNIVELNAPISDLINHDWLHSILFLTINHQVTNIKREDRHILSHGIESRAFEVNELHAKLTDAKKGDSDGYENMHMRFQAEILTQIASQPDNILEQRVNEYIKAWKIFAEQTRNEPRMYDPEMTPAAFALKMLAFNLVRAVPFEHSLIQNLMADKDVAPYSWVIEEMYDAKLTGVLFGCGKNKDNRDDPIPHEHDVKVGMIKKQRFTTKDYKDAVCETVMHALDAAHLMTYEAEIRQISPER